MKIQRGDIEKYKLIEHGKRMKTEEIIKENENIKNNLKYQLQIDCKIIKQTRQSIISI